MSEAAEVVDGEVVFDPETGWVNAGFVPVEAEGAHWPHPADRLKVVGYRDMMQAVAGAKRVPNLAERR